MNCLITYALLSFIIGSLIPSALHACPISQIETRTRLKNEQVTPLMIWEMHLNSVEPEGEMSLSEYNEIISSVTRVYDPIFQKQGLKLKIKSQWSSNEINAYSGADGASRVIFLYGGYARHPLMTRDAFLSVVCHEIGHHLGGFPRDPYDTWSSVEGQADYYSTLKCMKLVLRNDPRNQEIAMNLNLPSEIKEQCRLQFSSDDEVAICLRSAKASESYGRLNAALATPDARTPISLLSPSRRRATTTNTSYPSPQCRTDTKFQGALCNVSTDLKVGFSDENTGVCSIQNGTPIGARPACWFAARSMSLN